VRAAVGSGSSTRVRNWGTKTNLAVVFASIALVIVLAALIEVIAGALPILGWVGFGIVSVIVLGLGVTATLAVPRMRVSAPEPAIALDQKRRLLVVADSSCNGVALSDAIAARLEGAVAVHLVVPIRVSHLGFLTDDESDERQDAEESTLISVGLLRQRGISATGSVGTDKPLESMSDALGSFPAAHVLLAIPPERESYWLERGLLRKARALTAVRVTQVVVPSTAPATGTRATT
jgi:hypothetical protein